MAAHRRTPKAPYALVALAALAAGAAFLPIIYLVIRAAEAGTGVWELLLRPRTLQVLFQSTLLALSVTATSVVLGVPLAYLTTRTNLPGRQTWLVLAVLPLVIPSYVGAITIVGAFGPRGSILHNWLHALWGIDRLPSIYGFWGAWLTLALFTYPYIVLSVRAALLRLDPSVEEAARTLGLGTWKTFAKVTLPLLRPAIMAGSILVALYTLSDFGVVSMLRFDSFTRVIYTQFEASIDRTYTAALSLMLISLTSALVIFSGFIQGHGRVDRVSGGAQRPTVTMPLGRWKWPALLFCSVLVTLSLVVPLSVITHWLIRGLLAGEPLRLLWGPALNSVSVSLAGAALSVVAALPVALLSVRFPSRLSYVLEKMSYVGYALPGIVVALSLIFLGIRYTPFLYQTSAMLVLAYMVLFLPQAVGALQTSLRQINPRLEEAARSLGRTPLQVLRHVTIPMALPGFLAGGSLVFLTAMKELPATLLLSPIGFKTLATAIWSATDEAFFARAAAPMLLLILVSSLSLYFVLKPIKEE